MNREETAEAIKVMQAWVDGEIIEERERDAGSVGGGRGIWIEEWCEYREPHNPLFNFELYEYRSKPKPREFWINPDISVLVDDEHKKLNHYIKVCEVLE